jgi:hypothetical protein
MLTAFKYLEDEFKHGEEITPKEDHFHNLREDKRKAEIAIRRADPRGGLRARAIFVFESRKVAEDLLPQTAGKHLYEVAVNENDVLHRADLTIYDDIEQALRNGNPVDRLLKDFWDGVQRPLPRIELAVSRIRVGRKIADACRPSANSKA